MGKKADKKEIENESELLDIGSGPVRFIMESVEDILSNKSSDKVSTIPCADVFVNKDSIMVHLELPGVNKKDIQLSILENRIIVKAIKFDQPGAKGTEDINYICMERSFGRLQRSIDIPYPIHTGKINASFTNGVLKVTLARVPEKRGQVKRIKIDE